jgi:hypothetical protein
MSDRLPLGGVDAHHQALARVGASRGRNSRTVTACAQRVRLQRRGEPRRSALWPVALALKELTAAEEARIGALVKKAVG